GKDGRRAARALRIPPAGSFFARFDADLAEDVRDVRLHGREREPEVRGDLAVALAARDEAEDLLFALREWFVRRPHSSLRAGSPARRRHYRVVGCERIGRW